MPIRAIIADDEAPGREALQLKLQANFPEIEIVAICSTTIEAIEQIKIHQPELVFLDVMFIPEDTTGFAVLAALQHIQFEVIFVSGYEQYALDALNEGALYYVLKPIDIDELGKAIMRARATIDARKPMTRVVVPTGRSIRIIPLKEIIYAKGADNFTELLLVNDKKVLASLFLKEIAERLPAHQFVRIHNSYIVNLCHVVEYHPTLRGHVKLINGLDYRVSDSRKEELVRRLNGPMDFCG